MDIINLKQKLDAIVDNANDNNVVADLKNLLSPISDYLSNSHIDEIIDILTTDRNGDNKFDLNDLKLLGSDMVAISALLNAIMTFIASLPVVQVKTDLTGELVFKILVYVFIVLIPKKVNSNWNKDQQKAVISIALSIYNVFVASGFFKNLIIKIKEFFAEKGWCKSTSASKSDVLNKNFDFMLSDLHNSFNKFHEIREMKARIIVLENLVAKNKN